MSEKSTLPGAERPIDWSTFLADLAAGAQQQQAERKSNKVGTTEKPAEAKASLREIKSHTGFNKAKIIAMITLALAVGGISLHHCNKSKTPEKITIGQIVSAPDPWEVLNKTDIQSLSFTGIQQMSDAELQKAITEIQTKIGLRILSSQNDPISKSDDKVEAVINFLLAEQKAREAIEENTEKPVEPAEKTPAKSAKKS